MAQEITLTNMNYPRPHNKGSELTDEQIQFIRDHANDYNKADIAHLLNVDYYKVSLAARKHKIAVTQKKSTIRTFNKASHEENGFFNVENYNPATI